MAETKAPVERPLSPYLIYPWPLPMPRPLAHRTTGARLSSGTLLFGCTWPLLHHLLGGIRHLIWDSGHGFRPSEREWLPLATLVGSISLTLVLWVFGYLVMGGSH